MEEAQSDTAVLQQLAIWKDKYSRLSEQYSFLLNKNQDLEDRLINVVDKIERDKSLLSDEIDHLAEKLAAATNTVDYMKNECARYKSDCMLAVHLLQCQPSIYTSQHLSALSPDLQQKLALEHGGFSDESSVGVRAAPAEKKVVHFSASAMTFPPTAVFLQSNEPAAAEPRSDDMNDDVRDVFLKKIRLAPDYQTEKLVQCPKCGHAVVKYDRCTQTMGDSSYLSNSRSAPHLVTLDGENAVEVFQHRLSTNTGGDFLIDLSDDDRAPTPGSPMSPIEKSPILRTPLLSSDQQGYPEMRCSAEVHQHHAGQWQQKRDEHNSSPRGRLQKPQEQKVVRIALAEDV